MPEHKDIADPDIHEPKNIASAAANRVYLSNGSGSGSWSQVPATALNTSSIFNLNKHVVYAELPDVSTADFVLVPCPFACTLNRVTTILHAAITIADATITVTNSTGPATVGTLTIAFTGSAEGDIDTLNASVNNTFTAGTYVKVATDGASTTTAKLGILLEFTRTA